MATRYLFILFTCSQALTGNAQFQPCAHIEVKGENVLYNGIDNPITVYTNDFRFDSLTSSLGTFTHSQYNTDWKLEMNEKFGRPVTISVWYKGAVVAHEEYRTRNVPRPVPMILGRNSGGGFTVTEMNMLPGITLVIDNFALDVMLVLKEFTIIRAGKDGTREQVDNTGAAFTAVAKTLLHKAQPGDFYIFNTLVVVYPDGQEVTLPAMYIEVTK